MAPLVQDDIIRTLLAARARLSAGFIVLLRNITPGHPSSANGLIATMVLLNSLQQPAGLEVAELSITALP